MVSIKFTNEKGNVSVKARKHIKDSVMERITTAFAAAGLEAVVNADGGLSIAIAVDEVDGGTIFTHCDFSISKRDPAEKTSKSKSRGKSKAKTEDEPLPDLFADWTAGSVDEEEEEDAPADLPFED